MAYTFEQFLNVRSALRPSFSPDGQRVAFLSDVSGLPQLWSVPAAGGDPQQLTDYAERIIDARYAPAGGNILFSMDQGGDERGQLYLLADDTAAVTALTSDPEVIHTFGAWSPDGRGPSPTSPTAAIAPSSTSTCATSPRRGAPGVAAGREQRRRRLVARWPLPPREPVRHQPLQRALPSRHNHRRGDAAHARHWRRGLRLAAVVAGR